MATTLNLRALVDTLSGPTPTAAVFKAVACRLGAPATRLEGDAVTFSHVNRARWDGSSWDQPPQLFLLPGGYYWAVTIEMVNGPTLTRAVQLPSSPPATLNFAALIDVDPTSGAPTGTALDVLLTAIDQKIAAQATSDAATYSTKDESFLNALIYG